MTLDRRARLEGLLLGTAIGDALGLATEGLSAAAVARRGPIDRYRLWPGVGLVSDDTEQAALVAASLAAHPGDDASIVRSFRAAMRGWFLRLPWGLGWATLRACARLVVGCRASGVRSAGNGAAMRAAVVGAFLADEGEGERRRSLGRALAEVTHTDERAVAGALYVAEVAAGCCRRPGATAAEVAGEALAVVGPGELRAAIERALGLAASGASAGEAAAELGTTGFVLHTVPLCAFMFARGGDDALGAVRATIEAGGDTDSTAAIVGAWVGARHGAGAWPAGLVAGLQGGPFGRAHLLELAAAVDRARGGEARRVRYAWPLALLRNLALYPVVLAQGVRVVFGR